MATDCFRNRISIGPTGQLPTRSHMNLGGCPYNRLCLKVGVFRHNHKAVSLGVVPNLCVCCVSHSQLPDVRAVGIKIRQQMWEARREVLIKQEFHAGRTANLRSRSAAKARHARMSSKVRSGNSATIASGDIPPARYSSTSVTVILVPRMHGFPLRLSGVIVIRSV